MSEAAEQFMPPPPDTIADVVPLHPEFTRQNESDFNPINSTQYKYDPDGLAGLYGKQDADSLLLADKSRRPQMIIDTIYARLNIGPSAVTVEQAEQTASPINQEFQTLQTRATEIAAIDMSALEPHERQKVIDEFSVNVAAQSRLKTELAAVTGPIRRHHELMTAQRQAEKLHREQEAERGKGGLYDLVDSIDSVVTELHGDSDIIRSLAVLRETLPDQYEEAVVIARRTINTILLLRTFPIDDTQDTLDLGR